MITLLLLGFAATLQGMQQIGRDPAAPGARRGLASTAAVLGLLAGTGVLIEGYAGIAWPVATVALWTVAMLIAAARRHAFVLGRTIRGAVAPVLVGVAALIVTVLPEIGRVVSFTPSLLGSNLPYALPVAEGLGIWINQNFLLATTRDFSVPTLDAIAAVLVVFGLWWHLRRGRFALPAALGAAAIAYVYVRSTGSAYLTAKPLMIAGPVYMVVVLGALFARPGDLAGALTRRVRELEVPATAARWAIGVAFVLVCAYSTSLVLRSSGVNSDARADELAPVRAIVRGQPTLYLVPDDYGPWKLRGALVSPVLVYGIVPQVTFTLDNPGDPQQFDTITASSLNRFRYAVTTRSSFAPTPPPNWRVAMTTPSYTLWQRVGPTPTIVVNDPNWPLGVPLDCHSPQGRVLVARGGVADVREPAVVGSAPGWRLTGGAPVPATPAYAVVSSGQTVRQTLNLPAGRWEISLAYTSAVSPHVQIGDLHAVLDADLDPFAWWRAGVVQSTGGPLVATVALPSRSFLARQVQSLLGSIVAVPVNDSAQVPVRAACGRSVDWVAPATS